MSSLDDLSNIEFGSATVIYRLQPGQVMPKEGEIICDDKCKLVVMETNDKESYFKVMIMSTASMGERIESYFSGIKAAVKEVGEQIYKSTCTGMTALIGWEQLPLFERIKYERLAENILKTLNKHKLFIIDLDDDDISPIVE